MPALLIIMFFFGINKLSAQFIGTRLTPYIGDIYHTGGNIGIGTTDPQTFIHIVADHNINYDIYPVIRLQNIYPKSELESTWDISNKGNLYFNYGRLDPLNITMVLTETGQLGLGFNKLNFENSAIMQIESTDRGILIPRMTSAQKNNINSPANGLLVYDTDLHTFSYYDVNTASWLNVSNNSDLSNYLLISDFNNSVAGGITQTDTVNWNTAYNFSQNFTETDPVFTAWDKSTGISITESQISDFGTYLTSYTETDPVFTAHLSYDITQSDTANWNSAFSWGNHADAGYITADSQDSLSNKTGNISMWNNDAGYLTDADINNLWQENTDGNIYRESGNVGIGTKTPSKSLAIYSVYDHLIGSSPKKSTIRLLNKNIYSKQPPGPGPVPSERIYNWDIENNDNTLKFKFIAYTPSIGGNTEPETKFTFSGNGTITATKFIGDGSGLTNIGGLWQQNGDDIYYNDGKTGIGTANPTANLHVNNGAIKITGEASLGQGARLQINTGNSYNHQFVKFSNSKGVQFEVMGNGKITCNEVIIRTDEWKDNVFNNNYKLPTVEETERYISEHGHLPGIPSEKDIIKKGLETSEIIKLQMQKIEELTLYIIEQNKRIKKLEKAVGSRE